MLHTYFLTIVLWALLGYKLLKLQIDLLWDFEREAAQILQIVYVQWLFWTGTVLNFKSWDLRIIFSVLLLLVLYCIQVKNSGIVKTIPPLSLFYINTRLHFYLCLVTVCVCLDPDGSSTFVTVPVVCVCTQQIY